VTQIDLLADSDVAQDGGGLLALGRGYALRLPRGPRAPGDLYHRGSLSKRVNLHDKAERRLLAVELMQHGVNQTRLAEALQLRGCEETPFLGNRAKFKPIQSMS
jgi:hypothetical protein